MATEIAKAYVQIIPTTKGISATLDKELGGQVDQSGAKAGSSWGSKFASVASAAVAAAGIGKLISGALSEGSAFEQNIGGIETLFKESSDMMVKYANDAYKTAGLSANDYMETATSFAASLLQGTAGDTALAADIANQAIIDMSDNANKMGTDMTAIQNAYQGFAKQNYTMLDNLKLGYGGTKTEMERLLADAEKLTGIKYDINNLADVYNAIHVIQQEMGITGTTAEEAATTMAGSLASMEAAWSNVLASMASGEGLAEALVSLGDTVVTFAQNNLVPMFQNVMAAFPTLMTNTIPQLIPVAIELISTVGSTLLQNLPIIANAALQIILTLAMHLIQNLPQLLAQAPVIINQLATSILNNLPQIILVGAQLIVALVKGLIQMIPELITQAIDIGVQLVKGVWDGITSMIEWFWDKVSGWLSSVVDRIKGFFGIASPSKLMAEMGQYMGMGLAQGITSTEGLVNKAWDSVTGSLTATSNLSGNGGGRVVNLTINAPSIDESTVDYLIQRVNRELGAAV